MVRLTLAGPNVQRGNAGRQIFYFRIWNFNYVFESSKWVQSRLGQEILQGSATRTWICSTTYKDITLFYGVNNYRYNKWNYCEMYVSVLNFISIFKCIVICFMITKADTRIRLLIRTNLNKKKCSRKHCR